MKKIILILFFLISCVYLNAEQIAKTYIVSKFDPGFTMGRMNCIKWEDVDIDINEMLEKGWKVFSITPFITYDRIEAASRTYKILVIYER